MSADLSTTQGTTSIRTLCPQRLLPVVVIHDAAQADPLRAALTSGGLPCAEITLRTTAALDAITVMSSNPEFVVGAGTVLSAPQVHQARSAGARFIVSPGFSAAVAEECRAVELPYFPGVATPTDVQQALDAGFTELKFFPASTLGGPSALKAIAAPFGGVKFIPTGGITAASLPSYLALPQVVAVGGTWIANDALLTSGDYAGITRLAAEATDLASGLSTPAPVSRLEHL